MVHRLALTRDAGGSRRWWAALVEERRSDGNDSRMWYCSGRGSVDALCADTTCRRAKRRAFLTSCFDIEVQLRVLRFAECDLFAGESGRLLLAS